ncbi:MAG: hypothetical protein AB1758_37540, partial [Candidatus Eremiobacterota bacterium]
MDRFMTGGIPSLADAMSPLGAGAFGATPGLAFDPTGSLAAQRAGGCCGCSGQNPMQDALQGQMMLNNMLLQMLTMLIQLMAGRGGLAGALGG